MKFAHGSSKNISELEDQSLQVFDYIIDVNGNPSLECIDNGNDAEGIGIYAFIGDSDKDIMNAGHYTSEESGFVYVLDVDVEDGELMHLRDPNEIPVERLAEAINVFIDDLRKQKGFDKDVFDEIMNDFESNFDEENFDLNDINKRLKESGLNIELDEYVNPSDYEDSNDWRCEVEEQYYMNEPCSKIQEEGGAEGIAKYAINKAYNLWETIKVIGQSIAVHHTQNGTERYNKSYQKAIVETLPEYNLTATYVDNDNFAVIFDTNKIEIEKVIDLNQKLKNDLKEDMKKFGNTKQSKKPKQNF